MSRAAARRGLAALGLLVAAACAPGRRADGLPSFPIGLYTAQDPAELPRIKEGGFDHVIVSAKPEDLPAFVERARALGMGAIPVPDAAMRRPELAARRWPVAAWYLQDEPEVNRVTPAALEKKSAELRAFDPRSPQVFVIGISSAAKDYGHVADALLLDWYPVPHLPLETVAQQIDEAKRLLPPGKPLWFVVQAFDWRDDPPRVPGRSIGRFPDHHEIRFMSWTAVIHGAEGLFYFRLHRPNGATLWEFPELWQAVERVSLEMKAMKPVIVGGKPLPPPVGGEAIESRAWRWRGRTYVVLANRRRIESAPVPAEYLRPHWRPLFEARRDQRELLVCRSEACSLRPYQVLVLESRLWPL